MATDANASELPRSFTSNDPPEHFRNMRIVQYEVSLFEQGDPRYDSGFSLAEWRRRHGGYVGRLVSPAPRGEFPVDLTAFAHLDPYRTFVLPSFTVHPAHLPPPGPKRPRLPIPMQPMVIYADVILPDDIRIPPPVEPERRGKVALFPTLIYWVDEEGRINARPRANGATLAAYRDALGGGEGEVVDPYLGQSHHLSLRLYERADPETTYLSVKAQFTPEGYKDREYIAAQYPAGKVVRGTVTDVAPFCAFVQLEEGVTGAVHRAELSEDGEKRPDEAVRRGEILTLRVIPHEWGRAGSVHLSLPQAPEVQ